MIGYQGIIGAYSHTASKHLFPDDEHIGMTSFADVFESLESEKIVKAVLPIENTIIGSINEVYDLIFKYKYWIHDEITLKINHNLLTLHGVELSQVKKVFSHPKALEQCKDFFNTYPHIEPVIYEDTALAAGFVSLKQDPALAAIASKEAAQLFNLQISMPNIQSSDFNFTRFVVVSKRDQTQTGNKTSIVFATAHEPGSLLDSLAPFKHHKINLTHIESRPMPETAFKYSFYLDFEHNEKSDISAIIEEMKPHVLFVRRMGTYTKGKVI